MTMGFFMAIIDILDDSIQHHHKIYFPFANLKKKDATFSHRTHGFLSDRILSKLAYVKDSCEKKIEKLQTPLRTAENPDEKINTGARII